MSYKRNLVIGIDGGTWSVLNRMIERGAMPNLAKLAASGCSGILRSTDPPVTPPAWTTLLTGVNPDKHKVFDFEEFDYKTAKTGYTNSSSIAVETMLSYLSGQGKKVVSMNMPMTYPAYQINGAMVSAFGSPGINSNFTWPTSLKNDILAEIPEYQTRPDWPGDKIIESIEQLKATANHIRMRHQQELNLFRLLNDKFNWDVFLLQIHTFDIFMHRAFKFTTPEYLDRNDQFTKQVLNIFRDLDNLIGSFASVCDLENDLVMVVSDHGHGMPTLHKIFPNLLLKEWGYLHTGRTLKRVLERARKDVNKLLGVTPDVIDSGDISHKTKINFSKTKAFAPYAMHQAGIFLNLSDRWDRGIISQQEYFQLITEIKNRFLDFRHPTTGKKLIEKVLTPGELYNCQTPEDGSLGDLILIPEENCIFSHSLHSPTTVIDFSQDNTQGMHSYDGIYLIAGNNTNANSIHNANIADIAPTIYAALDIEIPGNLDGKVIQNAFQNHLNEKYSQSSIMKTTSEKTNLTKDEEKELKKHLKNMGYL